MQDGIKPKEPNIRLKEGAEPITVSGKASVGASNTPLNFPTLERQVAGWHSGEAKMILACYGDRYESLKEGCCNG